MIMTRAALGRVFLAWLAIASYASPGFAQSSALKRAADGKPDLSGVWQTGGVSLYGEPGSRPAATPPPSRPEPPSYQAWAEAKRQQLSAIDDPIAHCFLPGVPRIITMPMPFEIVQTPTKIVFLYEAFRGYRIIPLDDQLRHPDDLVPTWMGDSVGRWDGDSLVVDVVSFNDKTWLGGNNTIHTDALHVVERYTPNPDGTITYQARVEDPKALTKPWTTGAVLRTPPNHARVEEYECIENNQDLGHMKGTDKKF